VSEALPREHDIGPNSSWSVGMLRDYLLGLIGANERRYTELIVANDRRYSDEAKAVRELIVAADLRYEQRFRAQETSRTELASLQDKAVAAALAAAKEAVNKAETAIERRLENTNEWRETFSDRDRMLMPRGEAEVALAGLREKIDALTISHREHKSNEAGTAAGWSKAIGVVGLVALIVSIISFFLHRGP
jgi:hypothetical protein